MLFLYSTQNWYFTTEVMLMYFHIRKDNYVSNFLIKNNVTPSFIWMKPKVVKYVIRQYVHYSEMSVHMAVVLKWILISWDPNFRKYVPIHQLQFDQYWPTHYFCFSRILWDSLYQMFWAGPNLVGQAVFLMLTGEEAEAG